MSDETQPLSAASPEVEDAAMLRGQACECPSRKALLFVKAWLAKLESGTDDDDPLAAIRRKFHAPLHAEVEVGLNAPCPCEGLRAESITTAERESAAYVARERDSLRAELAASQERERVLREALYRGTDHGMSGEWFCASCSFDLKVWTQSGATGALPELCPLCKRAAAALATPEGTVKP